MTAQTTTATLPIRNISIIAHVDHGKTTLVNTMLKQSGLLAKSAGNALVMDSMDLERERGLTIMAKATALSFRGTKINIVDTPGHSDFGGEVERALVMVDGVVLLVDAAEGPLPQTRFVLEKALAKGHPVIVVVNKVDRHDARPQEVLDEVYELFIDLGADDDRLAFPVLFAIGRDGLAGRVLGEPMQNLVPLFETIVDQMPAPRVDPEGPTQFQAAMLDYDDFVGRLALGRIQAGELVKGTRYCLLGETAPTIVKLTQLYTFDGLTRRPVERAGAGDIVAIAGSDQIAIGDTLASEEHPQALPRIVVEEPTVSIRMSINDGPLSGRTGTKLTSRQIRERLVKETLHNVATRLAETERADTFAVHGRGELQLGILIEMMRREGYEMTISRPTVLERVIGGKVHEPYERLTVDVPDTMIGVVTELLAPRQGQLLDMSNRVTGWVRMVYRIPSRGMIGMRSGFLTLTRGLGVLHALFDGYDLRAGPVPRRQGGALVADRPGKVTGHAVEALQERGVLCVKPGDEVYEGMIIGETPRTNDLNVNIVRPKKLTNMRAAGAEELIVLDTPRTFTLEQAIAWIDDDELVEVAPGAIRLRKKVLNGTFRSVRRD